MLTYSHKDKGAKLMNTRIEEIKKEIAEIKALDEQLYLKEVRNAPNHDEAFNNFWINGARERSHKIADLKWELKKEEQRDVNVGDGVTLHFYSDAEAYTIIKKTKCTIVIQRDKATLSKDFHPEIIEGGFVGHCINQDEQTYTYEADPNGYTYTARWSEAKGGWFVNGMRVTKGRHEFYDYNF